MNKTIICPPNQVVSHYLIQQGIPIKTNCGGRGNCAQCLVRVIRGNAPISDIMRIQLTKEQLESGIRMACHLMPKEEIEIELLPEIYAPRGRTMSSGHRLCADRSGTKTAQGFGKE